MATIDTAARRGFNPGGEGPDKSRPLPPKRNRAPFVLAWAPERFRVLAGRVIPDLVPIPIEGGIHGLTVKQDEDGNVVSADFFALDRDLARRRQTRIPLTCTQDGQSYCQADPRVLGVFYSRWEQSFDGSDQIVHDDEAFAEWACWLYDLPEGTLGRVPRPRPHHLRAMLARLRVERQQTASRRNSELRLEELDRDIEVLTAEIDALEAAGGVETNRAGLALDDSGGDAGEADDDQVKSGGKKRSVKAPA